MVRRSPGPTVRMAAAALWLVLACGPENDAWQGWDFAFLSNVDSDDWEAGERPTIHLGSSPDGHTRPVVQRHQVTSQRIAWSPDGRSLAYAGALGQCEYCGVWVAHEDGKTLGTELNLPSPSDPRATQELVWSPSGDRLLVGVSTHESAGYFSIGWRLLGVNLDDGAPAVVMQPNGARVSWSPDGKQFVAQRTIRDHDGEPDAVLDVDLYLYDVERDEVTWPIINTAAEERGPSWSPDGQTIAYVSNTATSSTVVSWPVAEGTAQPLVSLPCRAHQIEWFADMTRLVVRCDDDGTASFVIVDAEGVVLGHHPGAASGPSPDGSRVLVQRRGSEGPTIDIFDLGSGESVRVGGGRAPVWRPVDQQSL